MDTVADKVRRLSGYKPTEVARILNIPVDHVHAYRSKEKDRQRAEIKSLLAKGLSVADIAVQVGLAPSTVWDRIYALRRDDSAAGTYRPVTLPSVSILNSDIDLEPADYHAGRAAQAAAGY